MVIISRTRLYENKDKYPDAGNALSNWFEIASTADWANLNEIKNDFNSVDFVGNDRYVFNIRGNKYRLVVMIHFSRRTIYIRFFGTHSDYDKIDCSTI